VRKPIAFIFNFYLHCFLLEISNMSKFKKLFGIFLFCFGRADFCSMPYERQFCRRGIKLYLDVGVGYFNMLFIKGKESKTNNKELALQSKGWMSILPIPGMLIKNEYNVILK